MSNVVDRARPTSRPRSLRAREALSVDGLVAGWGRKPILRDLSLRIGVGERVAILGPNGAGKTTLFDVIAGRLKPGCGRVSMAGVELSGLPLHERALLGLGYVPQEPSVFPDLTVRENLAAALRSPVAARVGVPTLVETSASAEEAMQRWLLADLADRPAAVLSGGERRRLEVARTLLLRPRVLLLDEPFTGLDPGARRTLIEGLAELGPGPALLITDHAAADVLEVCERVVVLIDGDIVFDGPVRDFQPGGPGYSRYFGA